FFINYDYYIIVYDFRAHFKNLEQWMKEKKNRPRPVKCTRDDVQEELVKSVERGCSFTDDFFIHVNVRFPQYNHIMCTTNDGKTYIEVSDDFDAAHGIKGAHLCIVDKKNVLMNETGIPDDILAEAADYTEKLTAFIGDNTTCEFSLVDGALYFYTGQKSSVRIVTIPSICTEQMRVISPGVIRGTIKQIDKSLSDRRLSRTNQKYVFVAQKPFSEFVDILQAADGFIFNEGSMLCHLAILLREKGIPARIIPHTTYEDDSIIYLE
ncbi:MAG: hypothetical protein HXS44_01045, partial [Theionarchaea archaeon]|nr:hypothetical protein [Theionarchaea archaeon]